MGDAIAGRRLLIVEEALKDFVGHWHEYVRSVAALCRDEGATVTVIGHCRATDPLRAAGVRPLFRKTPWDGDYRRGPRLVRKLGLARHNWLVFRTVREFLAGEAAFDCTFVPTLAGHHVWAWRALYLLYPRKLGRLVLLVRNNSASYAPDSPVPRFNAAARLFKWGLRSFSGDIAAGDVVFATDSERLASEYRRLSGLTPVVFPSPRIAAPPGHATGTKATVPVFACLGPARFEKGIDVLQAAIAHYLTQPGNPPARFVIQWPSPVEDATGRPYLPDPGLSASGSVEFVTQPLDSAQYDALLAAADCMVLPYRRSSYYARISGVAVEAVTGGIPLIVTADTWSHGLIASSGAGIAVPDGDSAALAEAMADMARDYPRYLREARARREDAARNHSGDAFLDCLWHAQNSQ